MTTRAEAIRHLWTHKTQDHPWLADEQLVIDRAEGVWVWTEDGKKLMDGFAGLAVVNVGHGRREIAEAIAEQTVRLAYYPTTRQFSNRPAAELAAKLAALTPGDLEYSFFAVSGAEVASAAALANIQIMEKDNLVANAAAMGARLLDGLQQAVGKKRIVGEVRGRGLMVCAELVAPDGSGRPLDKELVARLDRKAWDRGAIVYARGQVVRLAPPLCITPAEVDQLVDIVAASIEELEGELR